MQMNFKPPHKIEVKSSPVHGLGVFALKDIQKGELIEAAPIAITLKNNKEPHEWSPQDLMFFKYNGGWGDWFSDEFTCITFGYASLYNHDDNANVEHRKDLEGMRLCFYAKRDIKEGEECFIFYHEGYKTSYVREDLDDRKN